MNATIYAVTIWNAIVIPGLSAVFTQASAFAYMAFNLLCMPCFAAVGAIKKEMGS